MSRAFVSVTDYFLGLILALEDSFDKKLKKDYEVFVPYSVIDTQIDSAILDIQKTYKQKGFRTGKVPVEIIKEKYEGSIMAEQSQKIINETSKKIVADNEYKLAM